MSFNVSVDFRLNRGRIERMLHLPGGLVYRHMERRVRRVEAEARRRAPGSMGDGIRTAIYSSGGDFRGVIRSTHPASLWVIKGTRPHIIRPRRQGGVLRFTVGGRVVYAKVVHHPGNRPNDWLAASLRSAL